VPFCGFRFSAPSHILQCVNECSNHRFQTAGISHPQTSPSLISVYLVLMLHFSQFAYAHLAPGQRPLGQRPPRLRLWLHRSIWSPLREVIEQRFATHTHQQLIKWLTDEHGIVVTKRTLRRRLKEWGLFHREAALTPTALESISSLFYTTTDKWWRHRRYPHRPGYTNFWPTGVACPSLRAGAGGTTTYNSRSSR